MSNDMVRPPDLYELPGAPFTQTAVDAAVGAIRNDAGWHIAPVRTETVRLDAFGGVLLMLPTLRLVSVTSVRDMTTPATPVTLTDWTTSAAGMLYRAAGWPIGFGSIEVVMVHGFETVPPDLLAAVAARAQAVGINPALASRSVGPFSESYKATGEWNTSPAIARYALPPRA